MRSLVENGRRHEGRFAARPSVVNPLDQFAGLRRAWRRLRLKEWVGFTLLHPEIASSMIIQDAHYLASSELYAYVRSTGQLHQHAVNASGGSPQLPSQLYDGTCRLTKPGYELEYHFDLPTGVHRVRVEIAATKSAPSIAGELRLDGARCSAPLSVSAALPGGAMYTNKVIFPVEGTLLIGGTPVVFEPGRDLAILDEHRSFMPYRTFWVWGTFAQHTEHGIVGANFAKRRQRDGTQEESCLWTPGGEGSAEPLADIRFTPASADPMAAVHVTSDDGRLDVVFTPEGRKTVRHQFGLLAIDYFQQYGSYDGVVLGRDRAHRIGGARGVCETFKARL